ncbi:MAG: tRNA (adenosine(37)-N6)-dimethylallyltransferase MiaA [Sphingopyxis sp.]|nr:tRNA (adenosine(37)-N6)-dimethylallyltransferase MiaA [Sphingopyxis sp.]
MASPSFSTASARPPVALIAGPTASGKSALAVALAKSLRESGTDALVVNADASQVYADLQILSARPTDEEMEGVPHRLFGHIDAAEAHNAARWSDEARSVISHAHAARKVPILVGGTGLYLRSLLYGIAPVPAIDPQIREAVRALPVAKAHAALAEADPKAAERLNPADTTRVARALEVVRSTGRPLADWQAATEGGIADDIALAPLILLPPRDWLRERCDQRLTQMFDRGAVTEAGALLERHLDPNLPAMRAIGVPQIAAFLAGEIDRAAALDLAQAATRQYAKRQFTWFRHQLPIEWHRHEESLNIESTEDLAIILRDKLLTG